MTEVIENRAYGIDEASYQSENIASYPGAKFAIVKTTEGLSYQNPKARTQTITAKQAGIAVGGYHYGHFSGNVTQAIQEGNRKLADATDEVYDQMLKLYPNVPISKDTIRNYVQHMYDTKIKDTTTAAQVEEPKKATIVEPIKVEEHE